MHRTEEPDHETCVACGADVVVGTDRAFLIDDETVLCFSCALSRRGVWDDARDEWTSAPDVSGLASRPAV